MAKLVKKSSLWLLTAVVVVMFLLSLLNQSFRAAVERDAMRCYTPPVLTRLNAITSEESGKNNQPKDQTAEDRNRHKDSRNQEQYKVAKEIIPNDNRASANQSINSDPPQTRTSLSNEDTSTASDYEGTSEQAATTTACPSGRAAVKHFIMSKIEKTGSSTLYSMLARFIMKNKLNILTQSRKFHIDWTKLRKGAGWMIGPGVVERADTMICHARYNQEIYDNYFESDFQLIVPVRHPVEWLQSAAFYFSSYLHVIPESSPEQIIMDDQLMFSSRSDATDVRSYFHLPQLQWLGFNYEEHKHNFTAVKDYVNHIVKKIHVPILNDQFDASLIVMRRRFCWQYTDIFYGAKEVQKREDAKLSVESERRLLSPEVNLGELLLYESLNATWWRQKEVNHQDFWSEVEYFKKLNFEVSKICKDMTEKAISSKNIPATQWHPQFELSTPFCTYLQMSKLDMLSTVVNYAKGLLQPLQY